MTANIGISLIKRLKLYNCYTAPLCDTRKYPEIEKFKAYKKYFDDHGFRVLVVKFVRSSEDYVHIFKQDIKTYNHYSWTETLFSIHAIIHVPLKLEEPTNSSGRESDFSNTLSAIFSFNNALEDSLESTFT